MTKMVYLIRETDRARLWRLGNGREFWAPRSMTPRVTKFAVEPGKPGRLCQVEFDDWWWGQHDPEADGQPGLNLNGGIEQEGAEEAENEEGTG